ncbi:MAG TPA: zinc ribbon domain-containing protein, partial [Actinomycetota bacterium]|nr:zinc ribbon domain-containing protein [Actinomycetota bacterium]
MQITIRQAQQLLGYTLYFRAEDERGGLKFLFCGHCGAENLEGRKFCTRCGTPLDSRCPTCGAPVEADALFCGSCGTSLTAEGSAGSASVTSARRQAERRVVSVL